MKGFLCQRKPSSEKQFLEISEKDIKIKTLERKRDFREENRKRLRKRMRGVDDRSVNTERERERERALSAALVLSLYVDCRPLDSLALYRAAGEYHTKPEPSD
jgi:hypothetical protein